MAFNNVPSNGWPQIKELEKLDAIAKQIEDMPTFSSSDRAWLDEWENKLPELPADPETDGVKVLTATTENGETVKSWEELETGLSLIVDSVQLESAQTINGQFQVQISIDKAGHTPLGIVGWTMNNRADINVTGVYITESDGAHTANIVGMSTNQSVQPTVHVLYAENAE